MKKLKLSMTLISAPLLAAAATPMLITSCAHQTNNFDFADQTSKKITLSQDNTFTSTITIKSQQAIAPTSSITIELNQQTNNIENIDVSLKYKDEHSFDVEIKYTGSVLLVDISLKASLKIKFNDITETLNDISITVKSVDIERTEVTRTQWLNLYTNYLTSYESTINTYKSVTFPDYNRFNGSAIETASVAYENKIFKVKIKAKDWFQQTRNFGGIPKATMESIFDDVQKTHPGAQLKFYKYTYQSQDYLVYEITRDQGETIIANRLFDKNSYCILEFSLNDGAYTLLTPTFAS